jgi:hypothetical protein
MNQLRTLFSLDSYMKNAFKLKDLCVIKRNGWTAKVPLMDLAFVRFITSQQDAQDVIRASFHGIESWVLFW